jgi:cobalt-zinc-cadmium efflux system outer membrane protein
MGLIIAACSMPLVAQQSFTWEQIKERFQATNPTLKAAQLSIDEARAGEITAYLRPNPEITASFDQITPFTNTPDGYRPFNQALPFGSLSYLHERQHKRELRRDSAKEGTTIATSAYSDQERNLLFNLRGGFVQTLQAKAVLALTRENLSYYDHVLEVSRDRFKAGDIAQIDLNRLELQRVQFESDLQTATVSLRTAKIQLLMLLNDRTPVDQFDVTGTFDFTEQTRPLEEFRNIALETRPDLKSAMEAVKKARIDHQLAVANGSVDPTFGADFARNPPIPVYLGVSVTIPLKLFDRNQGEKARTQLDIIRTQRLQDANEAQIYSDVDSAYATLNNNLILLRAYKTKYLQLAVDVRETMSFSYQRGGASLLDFLNAQNDYRTVQLAYLNLIAAHLNAANQLNLAVGREVI